MRFYLYLLLIIKIPLLGQLNCEAQTVIIPDSILVKEQKVSGIERYKLLLETGWGFRYSNPALTEILCIRAYQYGEKLKDHPSLAQALNYAGVGAMHQENYLNALRYFKQAVLLASKESNNHESAHAHNNLGHIYLKNGFLKEARESYHKAFDKFTQTSDSVGLGHIHLSLAHFHKLIGELKLAEINYLKSYQIRASKRINNPISSALWLAIFYRDTKDFIKSNRYLLKMDSVAKTLHDHSSNVLSKIYQSENAFVVGDYVKAEALGNEVLIDKDLRNRKKANLILGKVYFHKRDYKNSILSLKQAIDGTNILEMETQLEAREYLNKAYQFYSSYKREKLENLNKLLILKDTVNARSNRVEIGKVKFKLQIEVDQMARENLLYKEIQGNSILLLKKERALKLLFLVTMLFLLVLALALYRIIRIRKKHHVELLKKQMDIENKSTQLTTLNRHIQEINNNLEQLVEERTEIIPKQNRRLLDFAYFNAHKVRGPLARILGLLSVSKMDDQFDYKALVQMLEVEACQLDQQLRAINKELEESEELVNHLKSR